MGFPRVSRARVPCARVYRHVVPLTGARALLEREHELETLREGLDRACAGEGALFLIEGPAGVGKTKLTRAARAAGELAHMTVLEARGSELELTFPFGVVRQLLDPVAGEGLGHADLFAGAAAPAARLFEPDEHHAPRADVAFEALHSLYWLIVNLADRAPLLVSVDDFQWVDLDSLRFLTYLAQRIEGLPVAMLLAGRPPDSGLADAGALWGQVASRPSTIALYPRPLSESAAAELAREQLGPARPMSSVAHATRRQAATRFSSGVAASTRRGGSRAVARGRERGSRRRSRGRQPVRASPARDARLSRE